MKKKRRFKVKVSVGGLYHRIISVMAVSKQAAMDRAEQRAMKEFPAHVIGATAYGAKAHVEVVSGK